MRMSLQSKKIARHGHHSSANYPHSNQASSELIPAAREALEASIAKENSPWTHRNDIPEDVFKCFTGLQAVWYSITRWLSVSMTSQMPSIELSVVTWISTIVILTSKPGMISDIFCMASYYCKSASWSLRRRRRRRIYLHNILCSCWSCKNCHTHRSSYLAGLSFRLSYDGRQS